MNESGRKQRRSYVVKHDSVNTRQADTFGWHTNTAKYAPVELKCSAVCYCELLLVCVSVCHSGSCVKCRLVVLLVFVCVCAFTVNGFVMMLLLCATIEPQEPTTKHASKMLWLRYCIYTQTFKHSYSQTDTVTAIEHCIC